MKLKDPILVIAGTLIGMMIFAGLVIVTSVAARPFNVGNLSEVATMVFTGIGVLVTIGGILVTLLLAIVAIWSDDIKALVRAPVLRLVHGDPEWTLMNKHPGMPAIYYHADVVNETPSILVKDVELMVTRCSIIGRDGSRLTSPLPDPLPVQARRRHGPIDLLGAKVTYDTIRCLGSESIVELLLNTPTSPNNFHCRINTGERLEVTLQAIAKNARSNELNLRVFYNGSFPKEVAELQTNLPVDAETIELPESPGYLASIQKFGRKFTHTGAR